jgi:UDP:flavonoid glycosyltransferase YjiC (YdhE family)
MTGGRRISKSEVKSNKLRAEIKEIFNEKEQRVKRKKNN